MKEFIPGVFQLNHPQQGKTLGVKLLNAEKYITHKNTFFIRK